MRILVLGGLPASATTETEELSQSWRSAGMLLGQMIASAGHDLLVCSPFEGSADVEVVRGWSCVKHIDGSISSLEFHYPDSPEISSAITELLNSLSIRAPRTYRHAVSRSENGAVNLPNSWLLAQLAALERSHIIVALGGNHDGAANLLLQLATIRRIPVLPFGNFGGASLAYLDRHRYQIMDCLGPDSEHLDEITDNIPLLTILDKLVGGASGKSKRSCRPNFFISYPRNRPAEADHVETTLRRRALNVFRDDHDFEVGREVESEIRERISRSSFFLALYCREYMTSPWCFDELEYALDCSRGGQLRVVILCLDDTRIVPPRARMLIHYSCQTRQRLESCLHDLIVQVEAQK